MQRAAIEKIPEHLLPYLAKQDPSLYTPIDHASWRYIMRVSRAYFSKYAHRKYLEGLKETGISTERIPLIEEMDAKLRKFGWRAVPVSGFIPPAVFMEFQSLGILPIACEMRTLEHLAYTPAPDIVHEAAGHAPIIADQEYANYLRAYGEVSRKAIFSDQDMAVYEAIRDLSDLKEDPRSTPEEIEAAQRRLDEMTASIDYVSEASLLSRMNWWTVEYGLVGDIDNPKIYGAGLLSSVGESYHCLGPDVKKIPFSAECLEYNYDITRPQPQLFVTPDFETLTSVLEEVAKTMAFMQGGVKGLAKAKRACSVATAVLDSGLQISGILEDFKLDASGNPCFLKFSGPSQLAFSDQQLEGHDADYHKHGYSSPIGKIANLGKSADQLTDADLQALGFGASGRGYLRFESGIELEGRLASVLQREGRILVLAFKDCKVSLHGEVLFDPSWGTFDMACGNQITSVFGGAADRAAYIRSVGPSKCRPIRPKSNLTEQNRKLNVLYARVREARESGETDGLPALLAEVHDQLESRFQEDWLLRLELLELSRAHHLNAEWEPQALKRLEEISRTAKDKAEMIGRGLELI